MKFINFQTHVEEKGCVSICFYIYAKNVKERNKEALPQIALLHYFVFIMDQFW